MKKSFMFCALCFVPVLLFGCTDTVAPAPWANGLVALDGEPQNCRFMYKLESEASVYSDDDAEQYLRNKIVDQQRPGNAYWLVSIRTRPNTGVVFGPEKSFVMVANVYDCPDVRNIETKPVK